MNRRAIMLAVALVLAVPLPAQAAGHRGDRSGYDDGGGYDECDANGDCGDQSYDQWRNEDRNRNRNRNRGAFSPGPFDRSPIEMHDVCISIDCSGREKKDRKDQPPPSKNQS